jgi:hypothetical protein
MKSYSHKKKVITIRLDDEMDEIIKQHSENKKITISDFTRELYRLYFSEKISTPVALL